MAAVSWWGRIHTLTCSRACAFQYSCVIERQSTSNTFPSHIWFSQSALHGHEDAKIYSHQSWWNPLDPHTLSQWNELKLHLQLQTNTTKYVMGLKYCSRSTEIMLTNSIRGGKDEEHSWEKYEKQVPWLLVGIVQQRLPANIQIWNIWLPILLLRNSIMMLHITHGQTRSTFKQRCFGFSAKLQSQQWKPDIQRTFPLSLSVITCDPFEQLWCRTEKQDE